MDTGQPQLPSVFLFPFFGSGNACGGLACTEASLIAPPSGGLWQPPQRDLWRAPHHSTLTANVPAASTSQGAPACSGGNTLALFIKVKQPLNRGQKATSRGTGVATFGIWGCCADHAPGLLIPAYVSAQGCHRERMNSSGLKPQRLQGAVAISTSLLASRHAPHRPGTVPLAP